MHRRPLITLAAGAVLLLAACSSGAATSAPASAAPSAAASVEASVEASMEASAPAASAPAAGAACAPSSEAGEVAVAISGFAFDPADISATIGQTITFANSDPAPHTATLDDDPCTTPNISQGGSGGLVFNAAGTYPFHCDVHPNMKGTITVS